MTANIKNIEIWKNNPAQYNETEIVRINFNLPCLWTTLTIEELKTMLRLWIKTEEKRYPKAEGFEGRDMLFKEIKSVFDESGKDD